MISNSRILLAITCALLVPQTSGSETIEWPTFGGAPGGGHFTPATQITPSNVRKLKQAWEHRSGDFHESSGDTWDQGSAFAVTPIMVGRLLYYCTSYNRVFALKPHTGEVAWVFDPQVDMSKQGQSVCRGVSSWIDTEAVDSFCSHRILLGTLDGRLVALDAKSGKRCPSFGEGGEINLRTGLNDHEAWEYQITSAPAVIGDLVISGAMVADSYRDNAPAGVVRAYNIRTGEFAWGWNPTHPEHSAVADDGTYTPGTTNVWSTISVDPARNLVIVPTGNSSPDYYGGDRGGHLDYYSSSVVALDASNGNVVWNYQTVRHDIWDYDVPAQPTLVDLTIAGRQRPAAVQVTKMGLTFVLDRETGQPLHPVEERAVPQEGAVPGEYLSPTQPFPLKPPPLHQLGISPDDAWGFMFFDRIQCQRKLEQLLTGPIYTPPSLKGTATHPSPLGGNNWGAPAIDLERKIMIANTHHMAMEIKLVEQQDCHDQEVYPQKGSPYCARLSPITSSLGAPCSPPPWATLSAIDLESGDILWKRPFGTLEEFVPWPFHTLFESGWQFGGPMVTKSGVTFIGASMDGGFRAFDTLTGEVLWETSLPTSANTVPMSYMFDGKQYVVIAAGGHFTSPRQAGDYVRAYSLPE
ncbi:MAG: pyrroloquinoline quinone-dependent dehydrogenase [Pseudomonadota bacterium]